MILPKVGEVVKVHLPGESPWAECVAVHDNYWAGRIDNKLFAEYSEIERAAFLKGSWKNVKPLPELHNHKQHDLINFAWSSEYSIWEPVVPCGQADDVKEG